MKNSEIFFYKSNFKIYLVISNEFVYLELSKILYFLSIYFECSKKPLISHKVNSYLHIETYYGKYSGIKIVMNMVLIA